MKCQKCPKPATYHITEILSENSVQDVHLCESCAKSYLSDPLDAPTAPAAATAVVPEATDGTELTCDACGLKFVEFRNGGRLGCAHDYDAFREDLLPLFENIHGDVKHMGKSPRRLPKLKAAHRELTQLRRDLQTAVQREAYEDAARLRDQIKRLEEGGSA